MDSAFDSDDKATNPKKYAILTFGGEGKRFGWTKPKQFYPLEDGRTLLEYVVEKFIDFYIFDRIVITSPKDYLDDTREIISHLQLRPQDIGNTDIDVISGGESREYSVWNGVEFLKSIASNDDIIVVHDGARPLVSKEIVLENIKRCEEHGAVVTAINSTDTVSYSESGIEVEELIERSKIYLHQTPQTFKYGIISNAMKANIDRLQLFSDDASIILSTGGKIYYVKGSKKNIKITTMEDMELFSLFLRSRTN
ncbi:MAG TPA: 2-C-methyl-D-erythritol 4-phosphate cytidylyltransferase [Fervidobacterium sp.]|nr:2-C-methyl-D-erythritol 4-phosphate cytidylyltransferase [Fervidobacterium sp.]